MCCKTSGFSVAAVTYLSHYAPGSVKVTVGDGSLNTLNHIYIHVYFFYRVLSVDDIGSIDDKEVFIPCELVPSIFAQGQMVF